MLDPIDQKRPTSPDETNGEKSQDEMPIGFSFKTFLHVLLWMLILLALYRGAWWVMGWATGLDP